MDGEQKNFVIVIKSVVEAIKKIECFLRSSALFYKFYHRWLLIMRGLPSKQCQISNYLLQQS